MRVAFALGLLLLVTACGPAEPVQTAVAPPPSAPGAAGPSVSASLWRAVLVAGDSSSPAFGNGVDTMRDRLSGQGVQDISVLAADPTSVHGSQLANAVNIRRTLEQRRGGACFAFLTSHGNEQGFFLRANRGLMGPAYLEQALAQGCDGLPTVLIVSACHSGVFINQQTRKPNRVILTAAAPERTSFGCGADDEYTNYDRCLLHQLDSATTWREVAVGTKACVERAERQMNVRPSRPQVFIGSEVADLHLPGR